MLSKVDDAKEREWVCRPNLRKLPTGRRSDSLAENCFTAAYDQ